MAAGRRADGRRLPGGHRSLLKTLDVMELTTAPATGFSSDAAKRAARNAAALAISSIVAKGLMFFWQLALARLLGASGYGIYGTIGALLAVGASIPEFGMGLIVVRDVASHPQDAGRYLAATMVMQPLLAVAGYVLLIAATFILGDVLHSEGYNAELRALLALAAASLAIDVLGNMCHNQLIAREQMVIPAIISTGHIVVLITLAGIAFLLDGGLWGLYAASLTASVLRAAVYWWALTRSGIRPSFPLDRSVARLLIVSGAPLAINSFLALAYTHTDKLITTALVGTKGTGQLTAGFVVVFGVIELLSTTILVAVFPMMSRAFATGQRAMFEFMIEKLAFFNLVASLPLAIFTSLLAVPLAALLFGPQFTRTADVLRVLIWYTAVTMVANVFAQALIIGNRQRRMLTIRSGGLAANIILNLILLPRLGVPGAAVASLITECGVLVLFARCFDLPADWWGRVRHHLLRLSLAAVGMAAVVFVLRGLHPLLAAVIGAPVYIGLLLVSGAIARDDWDLIYRMAVAMPGGALIGRYWKRELA